jgi:hypothetical protein
MPGYLNEPKINKRKRTITITSYKHELISETIATKKLLLLLVFLAAPHVKACRFDRLRRNKSILPR